MSDSEAPLYDHAQDLELGIERALPDWGGDEVFATVPRRRRAKAVTAAVPAPEDMTITTASRPAAAPPRFEAPAAPLAAEPAPPRPSVPSWERTPERKTVVITGRPFDEPRRRPARTVDQRIGHRPDRVAAWAVGLGFGLVLAAIVTAPL